MSREAAGNMVIDVDPEMCLGLRGTTIDRDRLTENILQTVTIPRYANARASSWGIHQLPIVVLVKYLSNWGRGSSARE